MTASRLGRQCTGAAEADRQARPHRAPDLVGPWRTLAESLVERGCQDLVDLYVERRLEVTWQVVAGAVTSRQTVHQDGAAVRRSGVLLSSDGAQRLIVAELLGRSDRALPVVALPEYPATPEECPLPASGGRSISSVRYLWRWSAVATPGKVVFPCRPDLGELTFVDGGRMVTTWSALPEVAVAAQAMPGQSLPGCGPVRVLLAPQPAAVLVHELLGHGLEGDMLQHGTSPWAQRLGERVAPLPLTVTDDPTRPELPGSFDFDDEGTPAAARRLVEAGVLVGALGQRSPSPGAAIAPGNARRATVHTPPRPRVSNLVASVAGALSEPPRDEADLEVLAVTSGALEPRWGGVVLHVRIAYALRQGRRVRALAPFILVGNAAAVCRGMLAASESSAIASEPGWCGKEGEVVPVAGIAPWLLVFGLEAR